MADQPGQRHGSGIEGDCAQCEWQTPKNGARFGPRGEPDAGTIGDQPQEPIGEQGPRDHHYQRSEHPRQQVEIRRRRVTPQGCNRIGKIPRHEEETGNILGNGPGLLCHLARQRHVFRFGFGNRRRASPQAFDQPGARFIVLEQFDQHLRLRINRALLLTRFGAGRIFPAPMPEGGAKSRRMPRSREQGRRRIRSENDGPERQERAECGAGKAETSGRPCHVLRDAPWLATLYGNRGEHSHMGQAWKPAA